MDYTPCTFTDSLLIEIPEGDIISTTDYKQGVCGPRHGCVFNVEGTDEYYFAYLEFGRRSTNRQIYVNRLEFNEDGTIRQVKPGMKGNKKNQDRYNLCLQYCPTSRHKIYEGFFVQTDRIFCIRICHRRS